MKNIYFILLLGIILSACTGSYHLTLNNTEDTSADSTQQSDFECFDDMNSYLDSEQEVEEIEEVPIEVHDPNQARVFPVIPH
jgi:PBP1b-binding outer membrane lipoprotein LpoB